ncbi:MAG: hypothetical protein CVU59_01500 [Deltaproteobacteria bacterium HGW-Deltaproteobacteria-17]|nr:MAG: hypothetical protein CVU59_01500 [Deltaproteobacteria bacterium HGW-Deltaproteobacteria-17]
MEQEQLRNHLDRIGQHVHEICKEIAEVLIIVHPTNSNDSATNNSTPLPVVNETPAPAVDEKGRISSRQLATLRKLCNEKIDGNWNSFDASCKARFGKAVNYLNTKEASVLISELIGGSNGHRAYSPNH